MFQNGSKTSVYLNIRYWKEDHRVGTIFCFVLFFVTSSHMTTNDPVISLSNRLLETDPTSNPQFFAESQPPPCIPPNRYWEKIEGNWKFLKV